MSSIAQNYIYLYQYLLVYHLLTQRIIVNANSYEEAEAIATSMVECGEADCIGQIVVSCSAYQ